VIIASVLSTFVLAGVLSTFLLLGRAGLDSSSYVEMNNRLRTAVERFDQDVRVARSVRWRDERSLVLVPVAGPALTYAFEATADKRSGRLVRQAENAPPEILVRDLAPDFAFARYRLPIGNEAPAPAANDLETALLEMRLRAVLPRASSPSVSQLAVSARCVLRNKGT
jgi:hypothetical protein